MLFWNKDTSCDINHLDFNIFEVWSSIYHIGKLASISKFHELWLMIANILVRSLKFQTVFPILSQWIHGIQWFFNSENITYWTSSTNIQSLKISTTYNEVCIDLNPFFPKLNKLNIENIMKVEMWHNKKRSTCNIKQMF